VYVTCGSVQCPTSGSAHQIYLSPMELLATNHRPLFGRVFDHDPAWQGFLDLCQAFLVTAVFVKFSLVNLLMPFKCSRPASVTPVPPRNRPLMLVSLSS